MNGIFVETRQRLLIDLMVCAAKESHGTIRIDVDGGRQPVYQRYETNELRDRAWEMLENAIASGVRLFRFPTDAELEKGDDE